MASTLKELLEEHPEYGDLPVVVLRENGSFDYISGSGMVFESFDEEENTKILVFAPN